MKCIICKKNLTNKILEKYHNKIYEIIEFKKKWKIDDIKMEADLNDLVFECKHWGDSYRYAYNPFDNIFVRFYKYILKKIG